MSPTSTDSPPPDLETLPDPIDPAALGAVELLPGEHVRRCWRTPTGYLVMSNLGCTHVWRKAELFSKGEWQTGPSLLFYDLAPPAVLGGRFVALTEGVGDDAQTYRFLVRDPEEVAREIEDARPAGKAEWEARRAQTAQEMGRRQTPPPPPGTTVIVREIVKVRCSYCGNLMDVADERCPSCGARQT